MSVSKETLRGSLDRRAAASYLSISTRLLDELARREEIPRIKVGRKTLFRVSDLDAFLESKIERLKSDPRLKTADKLLEKGESA